MSQISLKSTNEIVNNLVKPGPNSRYQVFEAGTVIRFEKSVLPAPVCLVTNAVQGSHHKYKGKKRK